MGGKRLFICPIPAVAFPQVIPFFLATPSKLTFVFIAHRFRAIYLVPQKRRQLHGMATRRVRYNLHDTLVEYITLPGRELSQYPEGDVAACPASHPPTRNLILWVQGLDGPLRLESPPGKAYITVAQVHRSLMEFLSVPANRVTLRDPLDGIVSQDVYKLRDVLEKCPFKIRHAPFSTSANIPEFIIIFEPPTED